MLFECLSILNTIGPDCLEACVFGWIIVLFFPNVFYILSQTIFLAFLFFFFFLGGGFVFWKGNFDCFSTSCFFVLFLFLGGRFGFWKGKFDCCATRCALWLCLLLLYCCSCVSSPLIASCSSALLLC